MDGGHVDISRAQSGIFCAAEAGRPGHRQRHENTRNTFHNTHIHSKTELSDVGPDGRPPTRPASRRRGSGGADGRRTKIRYQHTC